LTQINVKYFKDVMIMIVNNAYCSLQ